MTMMIQTSTLLFSLMMLTMAQTHAFMGLFSPAASHPQLKSFADAQLGKLLDVRLEFESLSLQGPRVKLLLDQVLGKTKNKAPLSSGSKTMDIVQPGFVVDMNGQRDIPFDQGSWEMIWREGQRSGTLVCALNLPEAVNRNQASIPAGRVVLEFHVWTAEGLAQDRAAKQESEAMRRQFEQDKQEAMTKYVEDANPLAKALHYHHIARAVENLQMTPKRAHIPLADDGLVPLANGLVMSRRGQVWTPKPGALNNRMMVKGAATVALSQEDPDYQSPHEMYKGLAP